MGFHSSFFRGKRGVEFTFRKVLVLLILAVVLILVPGNLKLFDFTSFSVSEVVFESCSLKVDQLGSIPYSCQYVNCELEDCSEEEEKRYSRLIESFEKTDCFKDESLCENAYQESFRSSVIAEQFVNLAGNLEDVDKKSVEDKLGISLEKKGAFTYTSTCKYTSKVTKAELESEFISGVESLASDLGVDSKYLFQAMAYETGGSFSPCIVNGIGAVGLIQFVPETAEKTLKVSSKELSEMNRVEQLVYVRKYLEVYKDKIKSQEDIYLAILLPSALNSNREVVYDDDSKYYANNDGFDGSIEGEKDGKVTRIEIVTKLNNDYPLTQYS